MDERRWPSAERLLATADAAEELRKAIWLGWRTRDPDSPCQRPGFREQVLAIVHWIRLLDALFHGRSISAAEAFADDTQRRELFVQRCREHGIDTEQDDLWSAFYGGKFDRSELARPGDDEHPNFASATGECAPPIETLHNWHIGTAERYIALWRVVAGLKPYFLYGDVAHSLNFWERPKRTMQDDGKFVIDNPWHTDLPWVRMVQRDIEAAEFPTVIIDPDNREALANHVLDAGWLDALTANAVALREEVTRELDAIGKANAPAALEACPVVVSGNVIIIDDNQHSVEPHLAKWVGRLIEAWSDGEKITSASLTEIAGRGKNVSREIRKLKQVIPRLNDIIVSQDGSGGGWYLSR